MCCSNNNNNNRESSDNYMWGAKRRHVGGGAPPKRVAIPSNGSVTKLALIPFLLPLPPALPPVPLTPPTTWSIFPQTSPVTLLRHPGPSRGTRPLSLRQPFRLPYNPPKAKNLNL